MKRSELKGVVKQILIQIFQQLLSGKFDSQQTQKKKLDDYNEGQDDIVDDDINQFNESLRRKHKYGNSQTSSQRRGKRIKNSTSESPYDKIKKMVDFNV